jgi:hypothetical protein
MKAEFSEEFLSTIMSGVVPTISNTVQIFPPRKKHHVGYNLLKREERKQAIEALFKLREYILTMSND